MYTLPKDKRSYKYYYGVEDLGAENSEKERESYNNRRLIIKILDFLILKIRFFWKDRRIPVLSGDHF